MNLQNYIWLIGGSVMSEPMCKEIKSRGYNLLLTDKNSNCHCLSYADKFKPISVYDEFNSMALARLCREKPRVVLCIGCDAGPTQSLLTDYFDLPGVEYHIAVGVKNKGLMRERLKFEHPKWMYIPDSEERKDNLRNFDKINFSNVLPGIAKWLTGSGSKGLRYISDVEDIENYDEDQCYFDWLLEEYCTGKDLFPQIEQFDTSEVALDCLIENGKVIYLNGALRLFWRDRIGIEAGHINPFIPDREIMDIVELAASRLGVDCGIFKIDLKYTEKYGWIVLECATRPSGGLDHMYTSPLATGKDITGIILDAALGLELDEKKLEIKLPYQYTCAYAPKFKPGKIAGWYSTVHQQKDKPDHVFKLAQGEIRELESNQDRPLFVIATDDDMIGAMNKAIELSRFVQPQYM